MIIYANVVGWVVTSNYPVEDAQSAAERLRRQAEEEEAFFNESMARVPQDQKTCTSLVHRLHGLFNDYLAKTWKPRTLELLKKKRTELEIKGSIYMYNINY